MMIVMIAAIPAPEARACSCAGATLTAMGAERPYRYRVRLGLEETLVGHVTGSAAPYRSWTLRSALSASFAPHERLTAGAMLPLVSRWMLPEGAASRSLTGLGDAEVSLRALVYRERRMVPRHLVTALAGLKAPTGPRLHDERGFPFPEDDQPGSGSWDPFLAAGYAWLSDPVSVLSSVTWRRATPGRRGWQRGQSVLASAGVQYQPREWIALGASADLRWASPDRVEGGAVMPDSGGTVLSLTPSLALAPIERWLVRVAYQAPVLQRFDGAQATYGVAMLSTVVEVN